MSDGPSMAIILLMSTSYAWLRRTVREWARQPIRGEIEVVLVKPTSLTGDDIDEGDFEPFYSLRIVDIEDLDTVGTGFGAGVAHASAPIVMMAEDHSFPDPNVAQSVLKAFEADPQVVAVGPVVANGNPETAASRSSFVVAFSAAAYAQKAQDARSLAGHNGAYRRDYLKRYGDELGEMYKSERMLQYDIEAKGGRMMLLADCRMHHWNSSRWTAVVSHAYHGGRLFAGKRIRTWGGFRRLTYCLGAPLIPIVRLRRVVNDLRESPAEFRDHIPTRLPAIIALLLVHAAGELTGYLLGEGNADLHYAPFELYRRDQLSARDLEAIDRFDVGGANP